MGLVLLTFSNTRLMGATVALAPVPDSAVQAKDSTDIRVQRKKPVLMEPWHWNVIRFNPTPMLLFSEVRNITLSYERLITRNQSAGIQVGYLLLPRLKFLDKLNQIVVFSPKEKYGVNLALDYRYYIFPRNNRPAPDGLYAGAFVSYYGFKSKINWI